MNSKDRVRNAINHVRPDRTPLDGWFTNPVMDKLKSRFGFNDDEDVLERLGIDFRPVVIQPSKEFGSDAKWMDFIINKNAFSVSDYIGKPVGNDVYEDEWGIQIKLNKDGINWGYSYHPLHDLDLKKLKVPDLSSPGRMDEAKANIEKFKDRFVYAGVSTSFRRSWLLTGFSRFLEALLLDRAYVEGLLEKLVEFETQEVKMYTEAGVDMIELLGDLGSETSLFLSPKLWREIFKPGMKAVIESVKGRNVKFFMHTDGNIKDIIPDLIEIGLDILNPIQPECMDPVQIKKSFGDKLTLHGSMSLQKTLSFGNPADAEKEAEDRIKKCGYDGGLILAPSNALTENIPVDNIVAFYDYVRNSEGRAI
jgi:uroporphyrinogen decarboxylase